MSSRDDTATLGTGQDIAPHPIIHRTINSPFVPLELVVAHLEIPEGNQRLVTLRAQVVHLALHGRHGRAVHLLQVYEFGLLRVSSVRCCRLPTHLPLIAFRIEPLDALLQLGLLGLGGLELLLELLLQLS